MADAAIRSAEISGRAIRPEDVLIAADPNEADLSAGGRTDTLSEIISTVYKNPPDNLTDPEKTALRKLVGVGGRITLAEEDVSDFGTRSGSAQRNPLPGLVQIDLSQDLSAYAMTSSAQLSIVLRVDIEAVGSDDFSRYTELEIVLDDFLTAGFIPAAQTSSANLWIFKIARIREDIALTNFGHANLYLGLLDGDTLLIQASHNVADHISVYLIPIVG